MGCVLLGVPHGGSAVANYGTLIARLGEVFKLGGDTTIMSSLNTENNSLNDITTPFLVWLGKYNVDLDQFFETEMTNYGKTFRGRWNEIV